MSQAHCAPLRSITNNAPARDSAALNLNRGQRHHYSLADNVSVPYMASSAVRHGGDALDACHYIYMCICFNLTSKGCLDNNAAIISPLVSNLSSVRTALLLSVVQVPLFLQSCVSELVLLWSETQDAA